MPVWLAFLYIITDGVVTQKVGLGAAWESEAKCVGFAKDLSTNAEMRKRLKLPAGAVVQWDCLPWAGATLPTDRCPRS
jgi:hypothetical protein